MTGARRALEIKVELARRARGINSATPRLPPDSPDLSDPTVGMSGLDKFAAGAGKALADMGRGIGEKAGLVSAQDVMGSRKLDAPLMATGAGQAGNVTGTLVPALASAAVPGANTVTGASALGAITGLLQPTAPGESSLMNTALGAGLGLGGQALGSIAGKALHALVNKNTQSAARQTTALASRRVAIEEAKQAGYILPPSQANPTWLNRVLEGFAGKLQTRQSASIANQETTNKAVKASLGVADHAPLSRELLVGIREQAGQEYAAVKGAGEVLTDPQYHAAIDQLQSSARTAAKSFPALAKDDLAQITQGLSVEKFDADAAIEQIKALRADADTAYAVKQPQLGKSLKAAATALEDQIDRHLAASKAPARLIKNYRNARQLIAQTYSVEKALNPATGNVDAHKLATQLMRNKPLSDGLKTAAKFGLAFPKAAQLPEKIGSHPGISPLDFATAAMGNVAAFGRAPVRGTILSKPYQRAFVNAPTAAPSSALQALSQIAGNPYLKRALPAAAAGLGLKDLLQQ